MPIDSPDGFPDDWYVPPFAEGDGFPDDWYVPPSAAPGAPQAAPARQLGAAVSARPNPSALDSFAAFLPFMPATRAAMDGWGWPLAGDALGQFPTQQVWPAGFPPLSAGVLFGSLASPQPATNSILSTSSGLFGGVATPTADASAYNMLFGGGTTPNFDSSETSSELFGGAVTPKSETNDSPSPAVVAKSPYSATLLPPLGPKLLLIGGERGDSEDDERRKIESPAVTGGLVEPGLWSPKQFPTLPSIPPLEVPPETAEGTAGTGGWELPPVKRGRTHEQIFGHNLHPNNPTVDRWEPDSGTVTSIKSVDLNSPTYGNEENNALYNKLFKAVNDLAEFQGSHYADIHIKSEEIKSRILTIIVPSKGTASQQEVMRRIVELGKQRGVTVNFTIYP